MASEERDTTAIDFSQWPVRQLGSFLGFRENRFQVIFAQSALDDIHIHGQGSNDIEVCGVLIGAGYQDSQGPYLLVEHCIRGNGAKGKSTNVTFTAETWASIQTVMDRDYADKKMIGWYHTHPGFGIFLSEMDVFICDNFFNLPWQIAFVYDPLSGEEGNFIWRESRPVRDPILIEDDVTPLAAQVPLISVNEAVAGAARGGGQLSASADAKIIELMVRVKRLEQRQRKLIVSLVFLATFVIIWAVQFSPVAVPVPSTQPSTQPAAQINVQATGQTPGQPSGQPTGHAPMQPTAQPNGPSSGQSTTNHH